MRLTRRELKHLIENYLVEQEAAPPEDEEAPEEESAAPPEEEAEDSAAPPEDEESAAPSEEDNAESEESEDTPAEETEEPGGSLPEKFKPFEIIIDDVKHSVQFVKDTTAGVLKLKIDDVEIKNPQPQDFVTMAGLGLQGEVSDEERANLETVVKSVDKGFEKFKDIAKAVKDKMNAERQGFSVNDIRNTVRKKDK